MSDQPSSAALLAAVEHIRAELELVREDLRQFRQEVTRHAGPSLGDIGLVIAIRKHVADALFSTAEVIAHARLPRYEALTAAIMGAIGALNGKKLGQRLKRLEGIPCDGIEIVRLSSDRDGALWGARVLKT